jgi:hypothetical protein
LFKETGYCTQIRTLRTEIVQRISLLTSHDSVAINGVTRNLLQPRLAPVGHGLVERLEVFERGLVSFMRRVTQVFVEPAVRRAPSVGSFFAQLLGEIFPDVRMRVNCRLPIVDCRLIALKRDKTTFG